ncbi:MAG: alpha/beta hydrolase [Bacteroidales bacterium]|nr:alpha/beta hydrolase [Bacteroidales bacterium]
MQRLPFLLLFVCLSEVILAQVTFTIEFLPAKTPIKDTIFMTSTLNKWNPHDNAYAFKQTGYGKLSLTINNAIDSFEYKLCRGNWNEIEVDLTGQDFKNRNYTTKLGNRIEIKVLGWRDLSPKRKSTATKGVSFVPTSIEMPQFNRKRTIRMYFPPNYSSGKRFPVIYMHDGQNLFDSATSFSGEWKVDEILDSLYKYHNFSCIVVGIYNGENQRLNEFSPWHNDSLNAGGDGDKYAKFIVKILKPFIDSHYRTLIDRENTAIIGSSMGGLISLYITLQYPEVFGKAAIFSPSLWFSPKVFEMMQKYNLKKIQKIYLISGAKEGEQTVYNTLKADSLLRSVGFDENYLRCKISKDGEHIEWFWSREFGDAVRYLFSL